jgi:hypothetical protein
MSWLERWHLPTPEGRRQKMAPTFLPIEEDEHLQNEAKELAQSMSELNRLRKN